MVLSGADREVQFSGSTVSTCYRQALICRDNYLLSLLVWPVLLRLLEQKVGLGVATVLLNGRLVRCLAIHCELGGQII